jgi:ABC-2 type transport system ATP-binding protein
VPVIQAAGLVKRYGRGHDAKTALAGLDLTVEEGEVFGYLGPNGAGKTTTIRLMLDFIRPTAGSIRVFGDDPRDNAGVRRRIGYLAGDFVANGKQTSRELLTFLGNLRGGVSAKRVEELAGQFDLDLSRRIGTLSKGNRQKVGLVQAFMHEPALLVLDEPTSGMDPIQTRELRDHLIAAARHRAVLVSSHAVSDLDALATRVAVLRAGELVALGTPDALRAETGKAKLEDAVVQLLGEPAAA